MYLTICTPTFNRAHTLKRVYKSLLEQKNKKMEWVVIDDGSTDDTEILIRKWINENKIKIKYFYQENQGKHIALNKGITLAEGNMFTCLDSDDWFYKNTVEEIFNKYNKIKQDKYIAGIIALDTFENGKVIGSNFDELDEKYINYKDLTYKHKMKGDKAYFYKTKILKKYDFPSYEENRHMPPGYQDYQISRKYDLLVSNIPLKYVEYQEDGISKNKYNKYLVAPDNFSYYRLMVADLLPTKKEKIINAIHFNATQYLGKVKIKPNNIKTKLLFCVLKPAGIILGKYIKRNANLSKYISHKIIKKNYK